jgi:hypothetical protein
MGPQSLFDLLRRSKGEFVTNTRQPVLFHGIRQTFPGHTELAGLEHFNLEADPLEEKMLVFRVRRGTLS